MGKKMKYEITQDTINKLVKKIESQYKVKFICVTDNFLYKIAMKKLAKKLGIAKNLIEKFLKNFAITIPWMFGKNLVMMPYRLDSSKVDNISKLLIIAHELQHVIDAQDQGFKKFYSDYVKSSASRAVKEARAISAEVEIISILGIHDRKTSQFGSLIYMLNTEDLSVITKQINRISKNIEFASTSSAKFIKNYLDIWC